MERRSFLKLLGGLSIAAGTAGIVLLSEAVSLPDALPDTIPDSARLANGMILQWGEVTTNWRGVGLATYRAVFPTRVMSLQAVILDGRPGKPPRFLDPHQLAGARIVAGRARRIGYMAMGH